MPITLEKPKAAVEKEQKVLEVLLRQTERFAKANGYMIATPAVAISREQEIANLCRTIGGCRESDVRRLAVLLLGRDIPEPTVGKNKKNTSNLIYNLNAVVVLIDNPNSHNYPSLEGSGVVRPIIISEMEDVDDEPWKAHGYYWHPGYATWKQGNYLPESQKDSLRPATEEEITKLAADIVQSSDSLARKIILNQ